MTEATSARSVQGLPRNSHWWECGEELASCDGAWESSGAGEASRCAKAELGTGDPHGGDRSRTQRRKFSREVADFSGGEDRPALPKKKSADKRNVFSGVTPLRLGANEALNENMKAIYGPFTPESNSWPTSSGPRHTGRDEARQGEAEKSPRESGSAAFRRLLSESRRGDEDALNALFEQFYPIVQAMVHRRLAIELRTKRPWLLSRFSTGDVVQEVFRSALRDLRAFSGRSEGAFAGYLAMIVRNRIVDSIRFHQASQRDRRKAVDEREAELRVSSDEDPSDSVEMSEEAERYRTALADFDDREQLLLRARFEKTHTFEALAETLGYSSSYAARRAFFKAQAILTQRLERD